MFSVIRRRNWQENQQKTTAAMPIQCLRCKELEKEIETLKANLLTAKSANNERVQDLQKHVETLVLQNENLVKTIQKLICQSTIIPKHNVKVPDEEVNEQNNKCATGLKLENKDKKENATKKFLSKGKTGVIGPQVKNKVIKGKSNKKFGKKFGIKKGKFGTKAKLKVERENRTVKVESKARTLRSTPQVAFEGKEVKIVVRKLECEGQFLYIGKRIQDDHKNVGCVSSDEEVDVERVNSSSSSWEDSDEEVLNNERGARSNKPDVTRSGEAAVTMKCLWHDPGKLICHKTFKGSSELGVHVRRVHLMRKCRNVKCYWQNCMRQGRAFYRMQTLQNHVCTHTGVKPYVCNKVPGCGKAFIKKYNAQHHTCGSVTHPFKDTKPQPTSTRPLNRDHLARNFTSSLPVTSTHQVVRASLKHHWCRFPRCGKKFATSKSLKQHQDNVHCPEKRFRCATCAKTFLHSGDLERHELLHGQRSFACPNCEKSFYDLQSLQSHRRNVHLEEKRYRCMHPNCSKMLSSSLALQKHVQMHTGQQPYRCSYPTCATRFTDKVSIKKHLLRVHTGNKKRCTLEGCNEHFPSRLLCVQHQLLHHMGSFLNPNASNGEPMAESEHSADNEHETDYAQPVPEKDTSYDIDINYEKSVQPEWDNFYGVKVKCEKPDVEESYDTQTSYEDIHVEDENSYDMDVNYEKPISENVQCYDIEENNVNYSDVPNGIRDESDTNVNYSGLPNGIRDESDINVNYSDVPNGIRDESDINVNYSDVPNGIRDESDTDDSIVIVDGPEPVVAVPDIWFV